MGKFICEIFSWPLLKIYEMTGNYGFAIIFFALLVNLIMLPFMAKSKKGMMRTTRIQPKIQELQRRHEGNPQKLNQEMQKLYREEGVNPMGGCIWSLIPFPILIALYSVIRQPLTRMMFVTDEVVTTLRDFFVTNGWYVIPSRADAYAEIKLANIAHQHWAEVQTALAGKVDGLIDLDFGFLGLNLGEQPKWNFFLTTDWNDVSVWLPALGLFLIPIISAALSWLSMKVSTASNPQQDAQTQASMQTMNLMMPLMSIWICFVMPAAMGIYWIANSLFGMIRDVVLTKIFKKQLDKEDAERIALRSQREKELEEKRIETERLRAEGKTEKNQNTSKKNVRAQEKQKSDERKAALDRAERAARRERLGIKEAEKPASQVGNRRYARGRAYVPDRFTNPEAAEEATRLAAQESENAEAIDYTVEESAAEAEAAAVETVKAADAVEVVEAVEAVEADAVTEPAIEVSEAQEIADAAASESADI